MDMQELVRVVHVDAVRGPLPAVFDYFEELSTEVVIELQTGTHVWVPETPAIHAPVHALVRVEVTEVISTLHTGVCVQYQGHNVSGYVHVHERGTTLSFFRLIDESALRALICEANIPHTLH